jgi:CheY-like chemotaxis protein
MNVLHFHANEKKLRLNLYLNENVPQIIHGDKLRLNQILYNLVVNAIKTTETGNINLTIENLNESREFVQLKFMIEDTSNGIPSDKIDAIFETFALIREKGIMREGIDVGLPIAKNLIEQQGGKINVISEIGKGSTFYFDLLFEIGEEAFSESLKAKANATLNKGPIKLLLVEDHLMNQVVAIKTLEKNWGNIEIILANDGQEAIQLLEKIDVDIILMDIQMPKMNGYETTSYIRRKLAPKKASLPIIAMTAHAHVAQGEKYKEYGMDDCIIKPFEPKELFRKITEHTFNHKILA